MKHGPIALLDERTPVVVVATQSPILEKVVSNMQEVRVRGALVIAVATDGDEEIGQHADEVIRCPVDRLDPGAAARRDPAAVARLQDRAQARPERRSAAQPGQDRDRRVSEPLPGGVGLDLLEIERLERALARSPRLALRLFTDRERAYAQARARPGQHLAARFCAKEAVAKALRLTGLDFREVEVVNDADGAPSVLLHGTAAARAAELGVDVDVSLTHTRTDAGAVVLLRTASGAG